MSLRALKQIDAYHGSLDSAQALHQNLLPEWNWNVSDQNGIYYVALQHQTIRDITAVDTQYPARAWLLAILKAFIEMEKQTEKLILSIHIQDLDAFKELSYALGEWMKEIADRDKLNLTKAEKNLVDKSAKLADAYDDSNRKFDGWWDDGKVN